MGHWQDRGFYKQKAVCWVSSESSEVGRKVMNSGRHLCSLCKYPQKAAKKGRAVMARFPRFPSSWLHFFWAMMSQIIMVEDWQGRDVCLIATWNEKGKGPGTAQGSIQEYTPETQFFQTGSTS